ncbi:MAG: hypothetical protein QNK79_08030 [Synechococcus sp. ArSW.bin.68]
MTTFKEILVVKRQDIARRSGMGGWMSHRWLYLNCATHDMG